MPDNSKIAMRAAAGDPVAEKQLIPILLRGVRQYYAENCRMPLQHYCRITTTPFRAWKNKRDYWLLIAHTLCDGETDWERSLQLEREIEQFQRRFWPRWGIYIEPPEGTSRLRHALFNAMKMAEMMKPGKPGIKLPDARRLHDIAQDFQTEIAEGLMDDES